MLLRFSLKKATRIRKSCVLRYCHYTAFEYFDKLVIKLSRQRYSTLCVCLVSCHSKTEQMQDLFCGRCVCVCMCVCVCVLPAGNFRLKIQYNVFIQI